MLIGQTISHYKITAKLGAGGMGEVYKATDTRLERTVAIKVLSEHADSDPDLKQRFQREAKTISSLNHPHICTLYEFDSQDGTDVLVMEYLDGETLADRLAKGSQPMGPFVSADGKWAGFFDDADDTLKKVSILGGPPLTICQMDGNLRRCQLGADNTIVFAIQATGSGLWRVPAAGAVNLMLARRSRAGIRPSLAPPQRTHVASLQ